MVRLSLKESGTVGTVSDADFQMLVDQLEEESEEDTDYYVTAETIALLEERGASETLARRAQAGAGQARRAWTSAGTRS